MVALLAGPPGRAGFLIADHVTGERLGNIALSHEDGVGDLSYGLAPTARGSGCGDPGGTVLVGWSFATRSLVVLGLHELRLSARVDNQASRAVAEQAGFRRDAAHDERREVRGATGDWVAYVLPRVR